MTAPVEAPAAGLSSYALRLGDDALVLAQRLAGWVTRAPQLEEDVALANIALDLLGQARRLLGRAGELEGAGRSEDDLAFLRGEREFVNCQLVELPDGDFAVTTARQLVFAAYQLELYERLQHTADPVLAGVAAKAVKEVAYHRDHAYQWTVRLGDGTAESHRRMQAGLDTVWPYVDELFDSDELVATLAAAGQAVDPAELREPAQTWLTAVLGEATLQCPTPVHRARGGRAGRHTEHMGFLLAEMQYLHRCYPGARW